MSYIQLNDNGDGPIGIYTAPKKTSEIVDLIKFYKANKYLNVKSSRLQKFYKYVMKGDYIKDSVTWKKTDFKITEGVLLLESGFSNRYKQMPSFLASGGKVAYAFSKPILSADKRYAIFYVDRVKNLSTNIFSGLIVTNFSNGKWTIVDTLKSPLLY